MRLYRYFLFFFKIVSMIISAWLVNMIQPAFMFSIAGFFSFARAQGFTTEPVRIKTGIILTVGAEKTVAYDYNNVRPALDTGYARALEQWNVIFEPVNCLYAGGCNTSAAVTQTFICANQSVDFIIGPGCTDDMMMSLELQTFYRIPSVTGAGDLVDSTAKFPYVTRCSYNTYTQWIFFVRMCLKFAWKNVAVIYNQMNPVKLVNAKSLIENLRDNFLRSYDFPFNGTKLKDSEQFEPTLVNASRKSRVFVVLAIGSILRNIMLAARNLGQTNGEYVFITLDPFRDDILASGGWNQSDNYDEQARNAYQVLMVLTLRDTSSSLIYMDFVEDIKDTIAANYPNTPLRLNYYIASFYDSILLYARGVNETVTAGQSLGKDNVDALSQKLWNRTNPGATGEVYINPLGDRNDDHTMYNFHANGTYYVVATFFGYKEARQGSSYRYEQNEPFHWGNPTHTPPSNKPRCGYLGDDPICNSSKETIGIALGIVCGLLVLFLIIGGFTYQHLKRMAQLANLDLLGTWREVTKPQISLCRPSKKAANFGSHTSLDVKTMINDVAHNNVNTITASFRGVRVIVRLCEEDLIEMNSKVLAEIMAARGLTSSNILHLQGLIIGPSRVAVMYHHCAKGSDILAAESVKLDWIFGISFIKDVINGLQVIQSSSLNRHGRLSSTCCFINGNFVAKIADYGLPSFFARTMPFKQDSAFCAQLLWTAPEHLDRPFAGGSQEGDVYSFAIMLQEIIMRQKPYGSYNLDPEVILARLQKKSKVFRPNVDANQCPPEILVLMRQCWANNPLERPRLAQIRSIIKESEKNTEGNGSILDTLIRRMETHTLDLQRIVHEKAQQFLLEKEKSEQLLYQILPRSVVDQLKKGEQVKPENFESVTVCYSDIVSFTTLSSQSSPIEVVDLLNDLYTIFDSCITQFDAYKIETIGDCYVVASGVPIRNGKNHAAEICRLLLRLLNQIKVFKIRHRPKEQIRLRLGAHTGPCISGVVGLVMPRFCLFGETITIAGKMESTSQPMKIQISLSCEKVLQTLGKFDTELRDTTVMINDKLEMTTYWLKEEMFNG